MRTYIEKGGLVINERLSDVERAISKHDYSHYHCPSSMVCAPQKCCAGMRKRGWDRYQKVRHFGGSRSGTRIHRFRIPWWVPLFYGLCPSISDMFLLIIENGEMIDGMVGNECGDGDIPRKYTADYTNAKSLLLQASSTTGLTNQSSFIFGSDDDGKTYSIMYILVGPFLFVSRRKLVRSLDANRGACPGDATARYS